MLYYVYLNSKGTEEDTPKPLTVWNTKMDNSYMYNEHKKFQSILRPPFSFFKYMYIDSKNFLYSWFYNTILQVNNCSRRLPMLRIKR